MDITEIEIFEKELSGELNKLIEILNQLSLIIICTYTIIAQNIEFMPYVIIILIQFLSRKICELSISNLAIKYLTLSIKPSSKEIKFKLLYTPVLFYTIMNTFIILKPEVLLILS